MYYSLICECFKNPKNMPSMYFRAVVQISVVSVIMVTIVYCSPPNILPVRRSVEERKCRDQILGVFKSLYDGEKCLERAFLYLRVGMEEFDSYYFVNVFFQLMKVNIRQGQVLTPRAFCEISCEESSLGSTGGLPTCSEEKCRDVLETFFPVGMVSDADQENSRWSIQDIVEQVYDYETTDVSHYESENADYCELHPESPYIMANYVAHVFENYKYDDVTPSPVEFCSDPYILGSYVYYSNL